MVINKQLLKENPYGVINRTLLKTDIGEKSKYA